jgi:hypothetical protein
VWQSDATKIQLLLISNFQGVNVILGLLLTLALGSYTLLLLVKSVEPTVDKCLS